MNEFLTDALYNFRRANSFLSASMTDEQTQDAILHFAFGIERVCKAILARVNPLFILEVDKFDNVLAVLYLDRLIPQLREVVGKELQKRDGAYKRNLLPFLGSLRRAASFSPVAHAHQGVLTKLSDLRGVIAHRPLSELDHDDCRRFLAQHFAPVVEAFAAELGFDATDCLGTDRGRSAGLRAGAGSVEPGHALTALIEAHKRVWEHRRDNKEHLRKAERETAAVLAREQFSERCPLETDCPACGNSCLLFAEADWDVEGSSGPAYITGAYVSTLECLFCGLLVTDSEDIDLLKLNDRLHNNEPLED